MQCRNSSKILKEKVEKGPAKIDIRNTQIHENVHSIPAVKSRG